MKPLLFILCLLALAEAPAADLPLKLLTNAHSHNDYDQKRPLQEALDQGFCSVEADIWLMGGKLLVAHTFAGLSTNKTLQSLYLDPLLKRVRANHGRVYPGGPSCMLLIDVKTEAAPTYAALKRVLEDYQEMLTSFTDMNVVTNAITAVISGNRAPSVMAGEARRLAGIDGRLPDLDGSLPPNLFPLISDSWTPNFGWNGKGEFPEEERKKLANIVQKAHAQGRTIRFWANPDSLAGWEALRVAGVDWINTDHLAELRQHLLKSR